MSQRNRLSSGEERKLSPLAQYEEVDVVFPDTAHTDLEVPYTNLQPPSPEQVDYQVVRQSQAAVIYNDVSGTRKPWPRGFILLRSNVGGARATLRLSTRQKAFVPVLVPVPNINPSSGSVVGPGGADGDVQYNNGGVFGGDAAFNFNDTTKVVKMQGQYYSEANAAGSSGASKTLNFNDGNEQSLTLTANCTLTFTNPVDGGRYTLMLTQDATGGRTVTWPSNVRWNGGTPPTLTPTANRTDLVTFMYLATENKYVAAYNLNYDLT